jgi:RNA polymerase sigma-70 factor (ECF subfamily)
VTAAAKLQTRIASHQDELMGFLRRRAPEEAEELSQEVWARVTRRQPVCPNEASFRGYLFTVARRLLIDHYRRRSTRPLWVSLQPEVLDRVQSHQNPESEARASQMAAVVEEALSVMNPDIAEVFRIRLSSSRSFQDIADGQGVGLNTALGRMHRATKLISMALTDAGLIEGGRR